LDLAQDKPAEAAALFAKAIKIRDARYDPAHPETLRLLSRQAEALASAGQADESKPIQ
jgi:hypothetical protein